MSGLALWRVERAWRRGRLPAVMSCVAVLVTLLALGAATWHGQGLRAEHRRVMEEVQEQARSGHGHVHRAPSSGLAADFTATLPNEPDGADVLRRLQSLCAAHGVVLGNVDITTAAATGESLGKVSLRAVLSGPYVQTKQVVADLLAQLPGAALDAARWRAADASKPAELSLSLTVWSAPMSGAAAGQADRASAPAERSP